MFVNVNTFNCSESLLCLKSQLSSSFLVIGYLPYIFFAQDKAPLQAMEEHSESTDDKGKRNIIVSYQERIVLKILIVQRRKT